MKTVHIAGVLVLAALAPLAAQANNVTQTTPVAIIDDADRGWMWKGMTEFDNPQLRGGSGHAGGPQSFGAYTFAGVGVEVYGPAGLSIEVDGRRHKTGKLRVLIDGKSKELVTISRPDVDPNACLFRCEGLANGNHVLQVQAEGGWAGIDYVAIMKSEPDLDDSDSLGTAKRTVTIPEGDYRICPASSTTVSLDVIGGATANGSELQLYQPTPGKQLNQWFHVSTIEKGKLRIQPLNAPNSALSLLQPIQGTTSIGIGIWLNFNDPAQTWLVTITETGYFRLSPGSLPELALTTPAAGGHIDCEPWSNLPNQQWYLAIK